MATFAHRNDVITKTRQAATALLKAFADLEAQAAAWDRGIGASIIDATGTDPTIEGYKANDFKGHEGLVKSDINKVLSISLVSIRNLLNTSDGKKIEDIAY